MGNFDRKDVQEMAADLKIDLNIDDCPEFARAPAMVITDINKGPEEVPGRYYTMVEENGIYRPVKEVSKNYKIIQHWEVLGSFLQNIQPFIDTLGLPTVKTSFQNFGCRMFSKFNFSNAVQQVNGDKVEPVFSLTNSADLTTQLGSDYEAKRLACTNGMMVPDTRFEKGRTNTRHYGAEDTLLLDNFIQESLGGVDNFLDGIKKWDDWSKIEITGLDFTDICEGIGFSENQVEKIVSAPLRGFKMYGSEAPNLIDGFKNGGNCNLWFAYNAITQHITDNIENLQTYTQKSRKASNMLELIANK